MRKLLALLLAGAFLLPLAGVLVPTAAADDGARVPLTAVSISETSRLQYPGRIAQAVYSPNGAYLAVAVDGGLAYVLNATTLSQVRSLTTPVGWVEVSSMAWGPNSDKVAVGYEGGAVSVYRVPGGETVWNNTSLTFDVRGVAWSPDGRWLAVGVLHSMHIFWWVNGALNATLLTDYGGSQPAGLSWSHDSDYVALGEQAYSPTGAIVAIFNTIGWTKSLLHRWDGPAMDNIGFEGRGRFLAAQLGGSRVEVWEVRNWSLFANVSSASGLEQFVWTSDGSRMITLETEPSLAPNETFDLGGFELLRIGGGAGNSSAMGASPDGKRVAVGYMDGTLRILAVGGERLFDDRTPLVATTGDPLTFAVRATAPGLVEVSYRNSYGGAPTVAPLTAAGDLHTLTITVPSNWTGTMLYRLRQTSTGLLGPERIIRVSDNDVPALLNWTFTRSGPSGETATATATVGDNIRVVTATFQMAIDGVPAALASSGNNETVSFTLAVPISPQNRTVRLSLDAVDPDGNGGLIFETVIALGDVNAPRFGADLSQPGIAGGRIQLGVVATDDRTPPIVTVTWRELTLDEEGPWVNFTYGLPAPGTTTYITTFPVGRSVVAVEYYFSAVDGSGNGNQTGISILVVADREPPEIVIDLTDREAYASSRFHLGIVVRDNVGAPSVVGYVQEDGGGVLAVPMVAWAAYGEGAYEANFTVGSSTRLLGYSFYVTDSEGNNVGSGTRTIVVKDNTPPTLAIVEPVLRVAAGAAYTFHVEVVDRSDIGNLTVSYRRAGETAFQQEEFHAETKTYGPVTTARFSVSLFALGVTTFRDGRDIEFHLFAYDSFLNGGTLGSAADPLRIRILDGAAPVARFAISGELVGGSLVSFDGSLSTDDLGVTDYLWTIDGQVVGNATFLSWSFTTPGDHTVQLTVADGSNKQATQVQTITLESPPPPTQVAGGSSLLLGLVAGGIGAAALVALLLMKRKKQPDD